MRIRRFRIGPDDKNFFGMQPIHHKEKHPSESSYRTLPSPANIA